MSLCRYCRDCVWYSYSIATGGRCTYRIECSPLLTPGWKKEDVAEFGWPRSGDEDASECEEYKEFDHAEEE